MNKFLSIALASALSCSVVSAKEISIDCSYAQCLDH